MATLEQVLAARDWRAQRQAELTRPGSALVCLTLNIAGPDKRFLLADRAFRKAISLILACSPRIALLERRVDEAGHCAFFRADMEPTALKRMLCSLEQNHPLGRLFDIDVLDGEGSKISRADISLPERLCLICDAPAYACARSRAHPLEQVQQRTRGLLRAYFDAVLCDRVQQAATRALLTELSITPKPGLVDRNNSGAHGDMDFFSFVRSASALMRYFYVFCQQGLAAPNEQALFPALQATGLQAERAMREATGGVNTHMGAVYSLGLIAGACGYLAARDVPLTPDALLSCAGALARAPKDKPIESYAGARGQAMRGFPAVRHIALPALETGASENDAGVLALLRLIAQVEDTNLVRRSSPEAAARVRKQVQQALRQGRDPLMLAAQLDEEFIRNNLSPGGCADLLAAALMVRAICTEERDLEDGD